MIEPYAKKVDPNSIYAKAAHVGGLGWMLKDAAHYEALVALVDYVIAYCHSADAQQVEEIKRYMREKNFDMDGRC